MDLTKLKHNFAVADLERLASFEPPSKPPPLPGVDPDTCSIALDLLKKWSQDNTESIQESIKQRAFGGKSDINWKIAFLPFMESCAVYLRDWGTYRKAWKTYREYKKGTTNDPGARETAISLYQDASTQIEELAEVWGMKYSQICDLTKQPPEGQPDWDGPYCGAFFTTDAQKDTPLIGIAFKGTNPVNPKEVLVDYNYQLCAAGRDYLDQQRVSVGVYTGLFQNFDSDNHPPYRNIKDRAAAIAQVLPNTAGTPIRIHVTGHSLGGSYSSFCYAQILLDATLHKLSHFLDPGDQYTFGAPRVGCQLWSDLNWELVYQRAGRSWRIVHDQDIVPQVPPTELKPTELDFYHVDDGMRIFDDKNPVAIPTERGGPFPPVYKITNLQEFIKTVQDSKDHLPNFYYDAIVYAIKHS